MAMFLGNCSYRYSVNVSYNSTYMRGSLSRFSADTTVVGCSSPGGSCSTLTSTNHCGGFSSTPSRSQAPDNGAFYVVTKYISIPSTVDTYHSFSQNSSVTTADGRSLSVSCDVLPASQGATWQSVGSSYSSTMWAKTCYHIQLRCTNSYINNTSVLGTDRIPWTLGCQPCV